MRRFIATFLVVLLLPFAALAQSSNKDTRPLSVVMPLANAGDAEAQFRLSIFYYRGDGVPKDHAKALELVTASANGGFSTAQNQMGVFYQNGVLVNQNYRTAIQWYEKAAEQEHPTALANLAGMYAIGQGTFQDPGKSFDYRFRAADAGNAHSQFTVGEAFFYGQGIQQDCRLGMDYLQKAGFSGLIGAAEAVEKAYVVALANREISPCAEQIGASDHLRFEWLKMAARTGDRGLLAYANSRRFLPDLRAGPNIVPQDDMTDAEYATRIVEHTVLLMVLAELSHKMGHDPSFRQKRWEDWIGVNCVGPHPALRPEYHFGPKEPDAVYCPRIIELFDKRAELSMQHGLTGPDAMLAHLRDFISFLDD